MARYRQTNAEYGSAADPIERLDCAAVCFDDGAADRKSETDTPDPRDASPVEFLEDAPLIALGETRAAIPDFEDDRVPIRLGRHLDRSRFGRVFIRVLQEVHQKLPHQNVVHVNQGKILGQSRFDRTISELALHPLQHGAYDLFQRIPVAPEFDARFETRNIQQVRDEAAEALGFVCDAVKQLALRFRRKSLTLRT